MSNPNHNLRAALALAMIDGKPMFGTLELARDGDEVGHWITLHDSGTHVFIKGGRVVKGPPGLMGQRASVHAVTSQKGGHAPAGGVLHESNGQHYAGGQKLPTTGERARPASPLFTGQMEHAVTQPKLFGSDAGSQAAARAAGKVDPKTSLFGTPLPVGKHEGLFGENALRPAEKPAEEAAHDDGKVKASANAVDPKHTAPLPFGEKKEEPKPSHPFEKASAAEVIAQKKKDAEMRLPPPGEKPEDSATYGFQDRHARQTERRAERDGYYKVDMPVHMLEPGNKVYANRMERQKAIGGSSDPGFVTIDKHMGTGAPIYTVDDGNHRVAHAKATGKKMVPMYVTPTEPGQMEKLAAQIDEFKKSENARTAPASEPPKTATPPSREQISAAIARHRANGKDTAQAVAAAHRELGIGNQPAPKAEKVAPVRAATPTTPTPTEPPATPKRSAAAEQAARIRAKAEAATTQAASTTTQATPANDAGSEAAKKAAGVFNTVRAPKGGAIDPVTGEHVPGGRGMNIHGAFAGQEKKPKAENPTPTPTSEKEHKGDGKDRAERQPLSPADLAARQRDAEDQKKWDAIKAGPIGQFAELSDKPGRFASVPQDKWQEFAASIGPEKVASLRDALEKEHHARVDVGVSNMKTRGAFGDPVPDAQKAEVAAWEKNEPARQAKQTIEGQPRKVGSHEKKLPGSTHARELFQHLGHPDSLKDAGNLSQIDNLHRLHGIASEALSKPATALPPHADAPKATEPPATPSDAGKAAAERASGVVRPEAYVNGDRGEYTGTSEQLHGGTFYHVEMTEGKDKGKVKVTSRPPGATSSTVQDANAESARQGQENMNEGMRRLRDDPEWQKLQGLKPTTSQDAGAQAATRAARLHAQADKQRKLAERSATPEYHHHVADSLDAQAKAVGGPRDFDRERLAAEANHPAPDPTTHNPAAEGDWPDIDPVRFAKDKATARALRRNGDKESIRQAAELEKNAGRISKPTVPAAPAKATAPSEASKLNQAVAEHKPSTGSRGGIDFDREFGSSPAKREADRADIAGQLRGGIGKTDAPQNEGQRAAARAAGIARTAPMHRSTFPVSGPAGKAVVEQSGGHFLTKTDAGETIHVGTYESATAAAKAHVTRPTSGVESAMPVVTVGPHGGSEEYKQAHAEQSRLDQAYKAATAEHNAIPGVGTGPMHTTPDAVKATPEYRKALDRVNAAKAASQRFNSAFTKRFDKEERAARDGFPVSGPAGKVTVLRRADKYHVMTEGGQVIHGGTYESALAAAKEYVTRSGRRTA